jgi:hypothetical protein
VTEERVPYLGFWIERKCGEDPDWVWCQTIVEEDEGSRTFALTERVHYDKRRSAGWPHDTGEVQGQLRRQGLAIARALIALDTIPDGQNAKVDLPAAGPPYVTPDGDLLALLILRGFRNLRSTYRNLGEDSLDVRGIGELLWASPNETEHIFERLRNGGLAEILSMGWDDNFGNAEATEVGLQVLDENDPILPTDVRGFAIREGSSDPPTPDLDSPDGVGDVGDAVFVVHGRNVAAKETVARWIERVSLRSIILHERANRGRTIIEKFDQEADGATYAVVLATGDDEARIFGSDDEPRAAKTECPTGAGLLLGAARAGKCLGA